MPRKESEDETEVIHMRLNRETIVMIVSKERNNLGGVLSKRLREATLGKALVVDVIHL